MTRPRIKHLRERLALWVAPWLKPGIKFGGDANLTHLYRNRAGMVTIPGFGNVIGSNVAKDCSTAIRMEAK